MTQQASQPLGPAIGTAILSRLLQLHHVLGLLLALFLLTGRWSPARLTESEVAGYVQIRFWLCLLFALVLVLPPPRRSVPDRSWTMLGGQTWLLPLVFLFYMMLSSTWSVDVHLALNKVWDLVIIAVVVLATVRAFRLVSGDALRSAVWRWVVISTGLLAALGILSALSSTTSIRLAVLAGGPNTFGRTMGLLFLGGLFMWRRARIGWPWIAVAMIAVFLVVLSGSRGAMVAVSLAFVCFLAVEKIRWTKLLTMAVTSLVFVTLIVWYTPIGRLAADTFQYRVIELSIEQHYTSGRDQLFADAVEVGRQDWMLGAGLAAFPALGLGPYPHNVFLESFSEGGVVATLLLSAMLLRFFRVLWRDRRGLDGTTLSGFVLAFAFAQFSGDFYDNRLVFIFLLLSLIPRRPGFRSR